MIGGVTRRLTPPDFTVGFQSQVTSYNLPNGSIDFILRPKQFDIAVVGPTDDNGHFMADGVSVLQAQLRNEVIGTTYWGIAGPDNGCTIDEVSGVIHVGTNAGFITVVVTNHFEGFISVSDPFPIILAPACTLKVGIAGETPLRGVYSQTPDGKTQLRLQSWGGTPPVTYSVAPTAFSGSPLDTQVFPNGVISVGKQDGELMIHAVDAAGCSKDLILALQGCCACSTCDVAVENKCVSLNIKLGWSSVGDSAGSLLIREETPNELIATPWALRYESHRPDVEVIRLDSECLTQLIAPECAASIITNSPHSYSVRLYTRSAVGPLENGLHTISGDPYRTVTIKNPANDINQVRVTDVASGKITISDFHWVGNGWQLVKGGGLFNETRALELSQGDTVKTEIIVVRNADDSIAESSVLIHQQSSLGWVLSKEVTGVGNNARTNTYDYALNGLLQKTVRGDGSWEYLVFDGQDRVTDIFSGFKNQDFTTDPALCRHTVNDYDAVSVSGSGDLPEIEPFTPRLSIDYIMGHEVGRTYRVFLHGERREYRCVTPEAPWNDPKNLLTIAKLFQTGRHADEIRSVRNPDGTGQIFLYYGPATSEMNIVLSGHFDTTGIDDGTRTISIYGEVGQLFSQRTVDIKSGLMVASETYAYDNLKRLTNTVYMDRTSSSAMYDCCGIATSVDRDGSVTIYDYDPLGRRNSVTQNGITSLSYFDAVGHTLASLKIGTNGIVITNQTAAFDESGVMIWSRDALDNPTYYTNYFDLDGQSVRKTTFADQSTRIETTAKDASLVSVVGTAVHPVRYDQGVEAEGDFARFFTQTIPLSSDLIDTEEWTKSYHDMLGRTYKTLYSDGSAFQTYFDTVGREYKSVDPDGVTQLVQYDSQGGMEYTALDADRDDVISFAGNDRITRTVTDVVESHGTTVRRTRVYTWPKAGADISLLVSTTEEEVNGRRTWNSSFGLTNFTEIDFLGHGLRVVTQVQPDGSQIISTNQGGQKLSLTLLSGDGSVLGQTIYGYDAFGRRSTIIDSRTGTTTNTYTLGDQIETVTQPAPAPDQPAPVVQYHYDPMGRNWRTVQPDDTSVTNEFYPSGELKRTYGSRQYPVSYTYDDQGRLKTMKTWQHFATDEGSAITTWNYDPRRGFLVSKQYDDLHGPVYSNSPAGRLLTRSWARGVDTRYAYDSLGQLTNTSYSDGTIPVSVGYDRLGRRLWVHDAGQRSTVYGDAGQVLSDDYTLGALNYASQLRYRYDALLRRTNTTSLTLGLVTDYGYDPASRLQTVSSGGQSAQYGYLANSPLIDHIDFQQNGTTRMTTRREYDLLNRLTNIASAWTGAQSAVVARSGYGYNQANQRTNQLREDGAHWVYQYDGLGQVTSGKKYWADGTPVAGQQFEYDFDDIGNRTQTRSGGDATGVNLRSAAYSANTLNQYTNRTVPGYVEAQGTAASEASVMVNAQPASRHGEYYRAELLASNDGAPASLTITNQATLGDQTVTWTRHALVTGTPENFEYDLDGNLKTDGKWSYTWDAENRLVAMESVRAVPASERRRLEYTYDSQGRRTYQKVMIWDESQAGYRLQTERRYCYEGWNLIGLADVASGQVETFTWGLDLSGSEQGAGGVGGLLWVQDQSTISNQPSAHFAVYDGNGNVISLVNATDGTQSASYDYGPFGETLRASGPMAKANPFRFSTKFTDDETNLVYYGCRYYTSSKGRWLTRDSISERGGVHLYGFVYNNPLDNYDYLGREGYWSDVGTTAQGMGKGALNVGDGIASFVGDLSLGLVTLPVLVVPDSWVPKCVCDGLSSHKGSPLTQMAGSHYGGAKVFGTLIASPVLAVYSVGDTAVSAFGNAWNGDLQTAGQNFGQGLTTAGLLATPFAKSSPLVGGYQGIGNWQQAIYSVNQAIPKLIRPKLPVSVHKAGGLYYQNWAATVLEKQFGAGNLAQNVMVRPLNASGGFGRPFKFDAVCRRADGTFVFKEFKGSRSAPLTRPNQVLGHSLFQQFGGQISGEAGMNIGLVPGRVIPPTVPFVFYNQFGVGQFFFPLTTGTTGGTFLNE